MLITIVLALGAALLPPAATPAHADTGLEAAFVTAVNDVRAGQGLPALTVTADLVTAARSHSRVMAEAADLHHNPDLAASVGGWRQLGENVGRGPSVGAIHRALLASPSHRDNILASDWTELGIGVVVVDGQTWVTQMFRQPQSTGAPAGAPAPTPGPTPAPTPAPAVFPALEEARGR